jgi:hypothetical protein
MARFVTGQSYMTRGGTLARVICADAKGGFPIIALVWNGGDECPMRYRRTTSSRMN